MEPDPGPLGLHPPEEGSPEEILHVAVSMQKSQGSPSAAPLETQRSPQLHGN